MIWIHRCKEAMRKVGIRVAISAAVAVAGTSVSMLAATPASAATCSGASNIHQSPSVHAYVPSPSGCSLREGDSGSGVIALQQALNKCYNAGLSTDGKFGPKTRSALISAQKNAGTGADGIFGPDTRAKLEWPFYKDRPENGDYVFSVCRRL